jgi:hypothetical protein
MRARSWAAADAVASHLHRRTVRRTGAGCESEQSECRTALQSQRLDDSKRGLQRQPRLDRPDMGVVVLGVPHHIAPGHQHDDERRAGHAEREEAVDRHCLTLVYCTVSFFKCRGAWFAGCCRNWLLAFQGLGDDMPDHRPPRIPFDRFACRNGNFVVVDYPRKSR